MSTAKHVFEKKLKPKLLQLTQGKSSTLINKEIVKITQTIESYLLSIVNPEWAVAIAISLAQDVPEGMDSSFNCASNGWLCCFHNLLKKKKNDAPFISFRFF